MVTMSDEEHGSRLAKSASGKSVNTEFAEEGSELSDLDEEWEDESDSPTSELLREQLEAVAMGLVGLGHLSLVEPKCGTSRRERLVHVRDLLDELANVRHWVSNRMAPPGWDPTKISTLALRISHPPEGHDDKEKSLPHHTLAAILRNEESPEPIMNGRRFTVMKRKSVVVGQQGGNANTAFSLSAKPPFTARGPRASMMPLIPVPDSNR
jgi:hypothetical protein